MQLPDLTALTLAQFAALLLLVAAVDTVVGILAAIVSKTFDAAHVADFIVNHVLLRVLPIFGLAVFGAGFAGIPSIPAASATASVALAAYLVETIGSLQASLQSVTTPAAAPGGTTTTYPTTPAAS